MNIRQHTRAYVAKDDARAWSELATTLVLYVACLVGAILAAPNWWLVVPLTVLMGLFGVRVYMLQHDCMHGSLFSDRKLNDFWGNALSVVALSPYAATRHNHNLHHAHVGDLDHREAFEIDIMTVEEFRAASPARRAWYRLYRSPFTLLVVGPFILYLVVRRFPRNGIVTGVGNVILHDALVLGYFVVVWAAAGWTGVAILLGSIYVGATFGAIIPYVVHNFEEVYWNRRPAYTYEDGALRGSSVLRFGRLFDWLTLNIAYHDLHHLNANVPCYNLKRCYEDAGEGLHSREIGWREAMSCYGWKLYDEEKRRMVSFAAAA
ncbi:fatty acid desaturase [Pseudaestuariivita atlantica]|uniref:Fatty acid desaturase domain-containing protein n=1 Tax=Pseudaestuariivita atlantica TaxID=1317121 RepID=A0A0L1JUD5_9RHOB|nr:fatty acid desaturase [Pseudaestuariivita atlantica]KNG95365.1 hypothetical protein ATO11_01715 [Pseudaestuariivita atlantica]